MIGIYKITNKINKKAYIGQSIDIERRWQEHIHEDRQSYIHNAIKKYGINNFSFEIIEECSKEELDEKEIFWIKYYNTFENGYNLTLGGNSGFHYNIEEIFQDYQRTHNLQLTAKHFGCHYNTVRNILQIFGQNHNGIWQEEKAVEKIDPKTLQVVATYSSLREAGEKCNCSWTAIQAAANGKHNSSCGFYWRYVGDTTKIFQKTNHTQSQKTPVIQLDYNTLEEIQRFESATAAAKALGKNTGKPGSCITAACRGRTKSAYGFKWKYADNNYFQKQE